MQTGGGESAVSLPPPHLPPSFIAYACRKIIHALQGNDWWVVVGVGGWDGVGRRRVLQRVVEMVTTTTGGDGDGDGDGLVLPFRHVVRMRKQEDEMEIRRRLEEKLISHFNNNNKELYTTLEDALAYGNQHSTLLVIEHDLSRPLSVGHIIDFGIVFRNVFLRVVAPATTTNWLSNDYKESFISDKFEGLSNGEAWDLLRHEANEIAGELHQQTQVLGGGGGGRHDHYSCSTDMIIMDCLLYTILFPTPQHPIDFPYYWWCEGLIIPPPDSPPLTDRAKNTITSTTVKTFKTFTEARNSIPLTPEQNTSVHYKKCTEVFHRVLDKLKERSIMSSRQNAPPYTIRKVLRSKVLKIATTLHDQYSATSKVRKKGRFIIQQDFPTQEQMEDVTRLSLQFAPVQECPQDPSTINSSNNCPSVVKCQNMEAIFHGMYGYPDLQDLEAIELFHLTRLRTLYSGRFCDNDSFDHVRSVHVESCPRLVILFSSTPTVYLFQRLEELVIKSCAELTDVFGKGADGEEVAPRLCALYLWDLPKLARVCDGHLPSLQTLQVRGCAKLRELPLFSADNQNDGEEPFKKLNISAEVKWLENLGEETKKHINFKPWSPWK